MAKWVVVTGGGGGLGGATVRRLASAGWSVVAADLPGDGLEAVGALPSVHPVALDVTSADSVAAMAAHVAGLTSRLDGVVNFAGIQFVGSLVEVDEADLARIIDINLMGTYRVNRALFDLVAAAGGRIVDVSSENGWQTAMPFNGPYAISKHAVEAYSDALRREVSLLGVTVVKLQPGPFRTPMVGGIGATFERAAANSQHFGKLLTRMGRVAAREMERANDPAVLADVVLEALEASRPKIAYSVRPGRSRVVLERLPVRVADRLIGRAMERYRS